MQSHHKHHKLFVFPHNNKKIKTTQQCENLANIIIPAELEIELKKIIKEHYYEIIRYKKPKHKTPSLVDAFMYLLWNRTNQLKDCINIAEGILQTESLEQAKEMAKKITYYKL